MNILVDFFSSLFMEEPTLYHHWPPFVINQVKSSHFLPLEIIPDEQEVYSAISGMATWNSPGPDGLPVGFFFVKCWPIIKEEVASLI